MTLLRKEEQRLLVTDGAHGRVVTGSVNQYTRTCKVLHLEEDGTTPMVVKDEDGDEIEWTAEYNLVDLKVIQRHRPRYFVCDELKLVSTQAVYRCL